MGKNAAFPGFAVRFFKSSHPYEGGVAVPTPAYGGAASFSFFLTMTVRQA